ncbi:MAG: DUF3426 domain-containing protein [Zoogloeaceae bacterium]|jgi:predicted Zn finger-like uncharacterized protein|nr:DUF3426 domain-containing protein [Zoogloeaceae bacterium]
MLTRCPHCRTAFRVTREQLLARDGKVRCGACRKAFNAMGYLDTEERESKPEPASMPPAADVDDALEDTLDAPFLEPPVLSEKPGIDEEEDFFADWRSAPLGVSAVSATHDAPLVIAAPGAAQTAPHAAASSAVPRLPDPIDTLLAQEHADAPPVVPNDEETDAASSLASVSRWAASPPDAASEAAYPLWPFVLVSLLLVLLLFLQMAYHYRSEMGRQAPVALRIFSAFNISMPLAQEVEWLSIDASELSSMSRSGHFQLVATLHNQSRYPQAWPQLEISLTDSYDNILTRRVFAPAEYLPAAASSAFAPGEALIRLDLDADDINPAGYRLYLFYF